MPWHIVRNHATCPSDKPHAVVKDATDEVEGCHPSNEAARKHMAALYANEPTAKATWSTAYVNDLPDGAFACIDSAGRHYPHHDASGRLDLPHLRAALSRIGDPNNVQCGKGHLEAHARAEGIGGKALMPLRAKALDADELAAWWDGRIGRPLLAIPFGGPIPSPRSAKGVDLDGEWFDEATDIYGPHRALRETRERLVDFHHSAQPPGPRYGDDTGMMRGAILGKSILHPDPDEDGWWVDLWFSRGQERVALVKRLAERGAQLFGSSQPIGKTARMDDGRITLWPFWMETISTTPQNTYSTFGPKAALDEAERAGILLPEGLRTLGDSDSLAATLRRTSDVGSSAGAELGRVSIPAALDAVGKALDRLEEAVTRRE